VHYYRFSELLRNSFRYNKRHLIGSCTPVSTIHLKYCHPRYDNRSPHQSSDYWPYDIWNTDNANNTHSSTSDSSDWSDVWFWTHPLTMGADLILNEFEQIGLIGRLIPNAPTDRGCVRNQTSDQSDLLKFVQNQIRTQHSAFKIKSRSVRMHLKEIRLSWYIFISHCHAHNAYNQLVGTSLDGMA